MPCSPAVISPACWSAGRCVIRPCWPRRRCGLWARKWRQLRRAAGARRRSAPPLIEVEYHDLPPIFDPVQAMQPEAPVVHDGAPLYEGPAGPVQPRGNISHHHTWSGGDVEQGFRESDLLFEHTFTTPWVHQGYMEPYACLVAID